ncbi:type II toxin-antitoxin system VapC family toxin [Candidatus Acidianus copahuensis]|nr:PIN domain-containing protein [Candidatus Acidianus copahuensis]
MRLFTTRDMAILDTSFLIAFLNSRDSRHEEALKLFNEIKEKKLVITDYILDEFLTYIRKVVPWLAVDLGGKVMEIFDILKINEDDIKNGWDIFKKYDKLSFTDSVTVSVMKRLKIKRIITFDSQLEIASKSEIKG